MLNNETSIFWLGWAYCPDYAEAATKMFYKKVVYKILGIFPNI